MSWFDSFNSGSSKVIINGVNVSGGNPPDPSQFLNSKDDRVIVLAQPGEYKIPQDFKGNVTFVVLGGGNPKITIEGKVEGNLDVGQGSVAVMGGVGKKVESSQGSIRVEGNVMGDVKTSQGSVDVAGDVAGDATTSMGNITVHGKLNGQAQSSMGRVRR
jgi:cytoskeletal protein CcmA (bactofilin family)